MGQPTPGADAGQLSNDEPAGSADPLNFGETAGAGDDAAGDDAAGAATAKRSKVPTSCTKAFDSLYFCYSPFYQARKYYITGELDNCRGRVRRFRMCVMSRFRPQSDSEIIYEEDDLNEKRLKGLENVQPVWELREEFLEAVERAEQEERESGEQPEDPKRNKWWL